MLDIHIGENLEQSRHNIISGDFCISTEHGYFPDKEWNDFIVNVLQWWSNEIQQLKNNRHVDMMFEDGPYMLRVYRTGQQLTIRFTNYEASVDHLPRIDMGFYEFLCILINAIQQTKLNINAHGLANNTNIKSLSICEEQLTILKNRISPKTV